jgi:hypothetical protein
MQASGIAHLSLRSRPRPEITEKRVHFLTNFHEVNLKQSPDLYQY